MSLVRDSFVDLERHRRLLEQNVDKLTEALDEWRQWRLEYEILRKEVKSLSPEAPRTELTRVRQNYRGDLVDDKVLVEIFGKGDVKKTKQVVSVLTNRIDYVAKNIDTLAKQLEAAENKLAGANVVSNPDATDEDGLPMTEIVEELDDEDNVVSYDLRTTGNNQPQLLEAMRKAGIKDLTFSESEAPKKSPSREIEASKETEGAVKVTSPVKPAGEAASWPKPKKKGVTFSEDTKPGENQKKSKTAEKVEEIMRLAKDQEKLITEPVMPVDDSEEEAQLRRDMLAYNLSEPAPVVAEINLEDRSFVDDDWEFDEFSDLEEEEDDDDDDEDQWGRYTGRYVDEDYREKMMEIQERLAKRILGHDDSVPDTDANADRTEDEDDRMAGFGRIKIKTNENSAIGSEEPGQSKPPVQVRPSSDVKKSVRFASSLDVAEAPVPATDTPVKQPPRPEVDPLSDTVVERNSNPAMEPTPAPAKKPSRFKSDRKSGPQTPTMGGPITIGGTSVLPERPAAERPIAPSGPEGKTISTTVLERDGAVEAKQPDAFDASLLQQEVAVEYNKMRNKLIQRQGGFLKEDESPIQPLDEEEGGPKRMSKFKVARLARS